VPLASFSRIPLEVVPAIRDAVRDPMLSVAGGPVSAEMLTGRVSDAWRLWHNSRENRTDVGRILPGLIRDARAADSGDRRVANALLADVYAQAQHEGCGPVRLSWAGRWLTGR
jgi:hypothetical protein